jgi:hypothetical protein
MKRPLLLLAVSVMMVLVAGSAVLAQPYYSDGSASASATASASASASTTANSTTLPTTGGALRKTGGPPLAVPIVMVGLILAGSGVAARSLVRRYIAR